MANKQLLFESEIPSGAKALAMLICSAQEYQSRINLMLKKYSLSMTQLSILHILDTVNEAITVGDIKEAMIEDSPNVSRALRKLEEKFLIEKQRDLKDQRIVYISITPEGRTLHIDCDVELSSIKTGLTDSESESLSQLLLKI